MGTFSSVIEFTGRTGNLVGAKGQDGKVIIRKHQPHVRNANREEQMAVRAKMALAGSLSKLIKADIIYGMTGNGNRGRRQRWMHEIMKRMTTTSANGTIQAVLAPSDLILSEGGFSAGVTIGAVTIADGSIKTSATFPDSIDRVVFVALYADSRSGGFLAAQSTVISESGEVTIPIPDDEFHVVNLYAIPIKISSQFSGVNYTSEVAALGEEASSYSSEAKSYNAGRYEWMRSEYVGSYSAEVFRWASRVIAAGLVMDRIKSEE